MAKSETASGGVGICGVVFVVFLTLKLAGVVNWSWWLVTAPLWIPWAAVAAVLVVVLIAAGIHKLMS